MLLGPAAEEDRKARAFDGPSFLLFFLSALRANREPSSWGSVTTTETKERKLNVRKPYSLQGMTKKSKSEWGGRKR